MKKAVLVVSFGTSHLDTLEKNITAIERDIAAAMPERRLYRAFTSGVIMKMLEKREKLHVADVAEALRRIADDGCRDLVGQPTHVLNGEEYDKLRAMARPYEERFERVAYGAPLLTEVDDYLEVARVVSAEIPPCAPDEAVVFMGHGSGHYANAVYPMLEYVFRDLGRSDIHVGTVEGYPTFGEVLHRLEERPELRRVRLLPLMIVAGDHAKNDLAGADGDSWKSRLEARGYEVGCVLRGLGEYPGIRAIFVRHALDAR